MTYKNITHLTPFQRRFDNARDSRAQNAALCAGRTNTLHFKTFLNRRGDIIRDLGYAEYMLICLLYDTGIRVSEALAVRSKDVDWTGKVLIRSTKTNQSFIIQTGINNDMWTDTTCLCTLDTHSLNRYRIYRTMQRYGLYNTYGKNRKKSVTHSGRHEVALNTLEMSQSEQTVKDVLHHRSLKSTQHYLTKPRDDQKNK